MVHRSNRLSNIKKVVQTLKYFYGTTQYVNDDLSQGCPAVRCFLKFFSYIFISVEQRFSSCVPQAYLKHLKTKIEKSESDSNRSPFFLEITTFLRPKSKNCCQIQSEDFFVV